MIPNRVGFVLLSNSRNPIPSTRVAAINTFPFLRESGLEPCIVFEPASATETPDVPDISEQIAVQGIRIVILQKVRGPAVESLINRLKARGIRTIYLVCDLVDARMAELTDATVVVTDFLKSLYPSGLQEKIHVVHDGIEHPEVQIENRRNDYGTRDRPLRAVLVTSANLDHLPAIKSPPPWLHIEIVGRYAPRDQRLRRWQEARWTFGGKRNWSERADYLHFLANRQITCCAWHPIEVYERMRNADIGILPIDMKPESIPGLPAPNWQVKSENRLTMKMCVGLPVIASPIPAYESVIEQGLNGFLARTETDWRDSLDVLRNPNVRQKIGETARSKVLERFSMEEQARRLVTIIRQVLS